MIKRSELTTRDAFESDQSSCVYVRRCLSLQWLWWLCILGFPFFSWPYRDLSPPTDREWDSGDRPISQRLSVRSATAAARTTIVRRGRRRSCTASTVTATTSARHTMIAATTMNPSFVQRRRRLSTYFRPRCSCVRTSDRSTNEEELEETTLDSNGSTSSTDVRLSTATTASEESARSSEGLRRRRPRRSHSTGFRSTGGSRGFSTRTTSALCVTETPTTWSSGRAEWTSPR